jgi:serine/threonine protein kinase
MSQISFNEKSNRTLSEFDFLQDPNDKNSKLGVGSFSCVKLAREKKTNRLHALKIVKYILTY